MDASASTMRADILQAHRPVVVVVEELEVLVADREDPRVFEVNVHRRVPPTA